MRTSATAKTTADLRGVSIQRTNKQQGNRSRQPNDYVTHVHLHRLTGFWAGYKRRAKPVCFAAPRSYASPTLVSIVFVFLRRD
jgi:hypothetical protein